MPIVVASIVVNGVPTFRVKEGPYLVGRGYFHTVDEVASALHAIGKSLADVKEITS